MKSICIRSIAVAAVVSVAAITSSLARDDGPTLEAIRKATRNYVEAFNRGDAAALAMAWSPTGTWSNPVTGETVSGRENLKAGFEEFFKTNEGARLKIASQAGKLLTETVAIEEGTADVTNSETSGTLSGYTAIHVLMDGTWLLDRVIETDAPTPPLAEGPLAKIDWLAGTWIDDAGGSSVSYQNESVDQGSEGGARFRRAGLGNPHHDPA